MGMLGMLGKSVGPNASKSPTITGPSENEYIGIIKIKNSSNINLKTLTYDATQQKVYENINDPKTIYYYLEMYKGNKWVLSGYMGGLFAKLYDCESNNQYSSNTENVFPKWGPCNTYDINYEPNDEYYVYRVRTYLNRFYNNDSSILLDED